MNNFMNVLYKCYSLIKNWMNYELSPIDTDDE